MKILIDASIVGRRSTGIGVYSRELARGLGSIATVTVVSRWSEYFLDVQADLINISSFSGGFLRRQVWREVFLRKEAAKIGADIVLITCPELCLRRLTTPSVIVVHDCGPLSVPEYFNIAKRWRFRYLLPRACSRATAIVAVSQNTAAELVRYLPKLDKRKVHVIGEGPGQRLITPVSPTNGTRNSGIILYVGTALRYKNLEALVQAAGILSHRRMVFAGPGTEQFDHLHPNIQGLGWQTEHALSQLLQSAAILVNPSLHEGFGLPALEALKAGIPTVLSDISAFREVAGDAARYVSDSKSGNAWALAIEELINDESQYEQLRKAGPRRAAMFSWDHAANQMFELLQNVLAMEGSPAPNQPKI